MRIILSIVAILAFAAATAFGGATSSRNSFSFPIFDVCNDEIVNVTGEFHAVRSSKENRDGTTTIRLKINAKGTGVGAVSGTSYVFSDTVHQSVTSSSTVFFGTVSGKTRLISPGASQNLIVDNTFAVDANGDVTSITVNNCRGAGK